VRSESGEWSTVTLSVGGVRPLLAIYFRATSLEAHPTCHHASDTCVGCLTAKRTDYRINGSETMNGAKADRGSLSPKLTAQDA
jgi:hypothetical protein